MNCAYGLTAEQRQACSDNPLATYIGARLPVLIVLVMVSNIVGLILVTLSLLSNLTSTAFLINPATVHAISFTFTLWMLITGIVLALELWWIKRNHLVPEQLQRRRQKPGLWRRSTDPRPSTLADNPEAVAKMAEVAGEPLDTAYTTEDLMDEMAGLIRLLQREIATRTRLQADARHKLVAESHRSVEVMCQVLMDIVEIHRRAISEKERMGYDGPGTGFKQLAHTHKTFEVSGAVVEAGIKMVKVPKKGTCKPRNASHTRHRGSRVRDDQPKGGI